MKGHLIFHRYLVYFLPVLIFVSFSCEENLPVPGVYELGSYEILIDRDLMDPTNFGRSTTDSIHFYFARKSYIEEACYRVLFFLQLNNTLQDEPLVLDNNTIIAELLIEYDEPDTSAQILLNADIDIDIPFIPIGQSRLIGSYLWDQRSAENQRFVEAFFDEHPDSLSLNLTARFISVTIEEITGNTDIVVNNLDDEVRFTVMNYSEPSYLSVRSAIGFVCELFVPLQADSSLAWGN